MTRERAIELIGSMKGDLCDFYDDNDLIALEMAISALKDIEKIQIIIDTYFTRGSKSGYECMGEIDRILEPYQKGSE